MPKQYINGVFIAEKQFNDGVRNPAGGTTKGIRVK